MTETDLLLAAFFYAAGLLCLRVALMLLRIEWGLEPHIGDKIRQRRG